MIRVVRVRGRGRVRVRESKPLCAAFNSKWSGLGRNQMEKSAVRRPELSVNAFNWILRARVRVRVRVRG